MIRLLLLLRLVNEDGICVEERDCASRCARTDVCVVLQLPGAHVADEYLDGSKRNTTFNHPRDKGMPQIMKWHTANARLFRKVVYARCDDMWASMTPNPIIQICSRRDGQCENATVLLGFVRAFGASVTCES